ncbi:hypothetical protein [Afifella sp. IM 167]|uniref:hypothetical protein n=1 Tax=Afifella sp. IM 167 TaxID=2033586 RepID=UPI001CCE756A|nr:hypothetical protein [Afifella sp. IM 167]MBZ8134544.1 hypothetical protein [Afifella sp. IM 167]
MRRLHRLNLLLAIACLVPGSAVASPAGEDLFRQFLQKVDALPQWSASATSIISEEDEVVAAAVTFQRADPALTITLDTLRMTDPAERPGGGFSAEGLAMTGVEIVTERATARAPEVSAENLSLPDLIGMEFDDQRPFASLGALYSRLAEGAVSLAEVPKIEMTVLPREGGRTHFTYEGLKVTGWANGSVLRSEAGPITIETRGEKPTRLRLATAVGEGIDLLSLAQLFSDRPDSGARPWRSAVKNFAYSGISGTGENGFTFSVAEIAGSELAVRPPAEPFVRALDELSALPKDGKARAKAEDDPQAATKAVGALLSSIRLGNFRIGRILAEKTGEEAGSLEIGGFALSDLSLASLGSMTLSGLSVHAPGGYGALEAFRLDKLSFPELSAVTELVGLGLPESGEPSAEQKEAIAELVPRLVPRLESFSIKGLALGQSEAGALRIASLSGNIDGYKGILPTGGTSEISGLVIPGLLLRSDPKAAAFFDRLGYDQIRIDMQSASNWQAESGLSQSASTMRVADVADMSAAYGLAGVTEQWIRQVSLASMDQENGNLKSIGLLMGLRLESATLSITDRSIVDRGFAFVAAQQNQPEEAFKEQTVAALPFLLATMAPPEVANLVATPLQDFLNGKGTLVARARPGEPMRIDEILFAAKSDPASLIDLLGLEVSVVGTPPVPELLQQR